MNKKIRILVVEDEVLISLNMQHTLKILGYEIAGTAFTGKSAIEAVNNLNPDLILMDIRLRGDLDGIDAIKIIKEDHNIPFIYLTSFSDTLTLERAKLTEPLGYLLKPFDDKELNSVMQMALYKHDLDKKLKENERWLYTTLSSIGEGVIATDASGKINFMNLVAEELTGWKQEEALGLDLINVFDICDEETGERIETPVDIVLRERKIVGLANHTLLRDKQGLMKYITDTAAPILNDEDELSGVVLIFRNVTNKKLSDIALKLSEEKFRSVFEKSAIGMVICNLSGEIIDANQSFYNFVNYDKVEFKHLNFFNFISSEQVVQITDSFKKLNLDKLKSFELEIQFLTKEENIVWGYSTAVGVSDSKQNYIIIVIQDITNAKVAVQAVKEQEENYSTLIESSIDAIYVLQGNRLKLVNEAWVNLFGYSKEEALSGNFDVMKIMSKESKEVFQKRLDDKKTLKGSSRYEIVALDKNGKKINLEASESHTTWEGCDALQGIYHDITKRKLEEERLKYASELAEKSNRLKSEFLAQMSHEIRTPLNNILTFTSLLKEELEDKLPEGMESTFSIIDNSAQRLIRTIDSILNLSRIQTGNYEVKFERIDLDKDVLDDLVLEFYMRAREKNIELVFENNARNSIVTGDRYSLIQLFINLIDNAIKYTSTGSVKIIISNVKESVAVEISDTGVGISERFLPDIFNPFAQEDADRTRAYEGTGLGLTLVKNYATINKAMINVQSIKGTGTIFTVFFFH